MIAPVRVERDRACRASGTQRGRHDGPLVESLLSCNLTLRFPATLINRRLYPSVGLHGQVAHEIGRRIVSGAIGEGDFLPREAELSAQFSVSRQAVREALKVLAAKGLVKSRRRTGTLVTPRGSWNLLDPDVLAWHPRGALTPEFLRDLVELRRLIEPAAAAFAARRGLPERIAAIGAALDEMRRADTASDAFFGADARFHVAIFVASGNTLIDRLSTILGPVMRASFPIHYEGAAALLGSIEDIRAVVDSSIAVHAAVYDAIVRGDAERARQAMESLLSIVSSEVVNIARKNPEDAG
jgi:GntR family galactonate operon transcriptional repressor